MFGGSVDTGGMANVVGRDEQDGYPPPDLSGAGTALAAWPGAVVELDAAGTARGANGLGRLMLENVDPASSAVLHGLAAIATQAGGSVRDRIEVAIEGKCRWYECVALPCAGDRVIVLGRDDTYDISIRQALFDSRQRYRDLVTISSDFAWETGPDGTFVFVSPQGALGYSADELLGRRPRELVADRDIEESELPFHARAPVSHAQVWLRDVDGAEACVLASAVPVRDASNGWRGVRGLCRDVTRERLRDSELAQSKIREQVVAYVVNQIREEARPRAMLEAAVGVLGRATTSTAAVFSFDDGEACTLSALYGGWPEAALSRCVEAFVRDGRRYLETVAEGFRVLGRTTRYHGAINGAVVLARPAAAKPWSDEDNAMLDAVAGQLAIGLRQIADQRELERLSTTDGLTGLMNRRAFDEALARSVRRSVRSGRPGVLLYIDLDNFKIVNDTHGHEFGDRVLCEVASILRARARDYDLVARIGGDEFVIWLNEMAFEDAKRRAGEVVDALAGLRRHSGDPGRPLSGSVGIAAADPAGAESLEALLMRADAAMYAAKRGGKSRWSDAAEAGRVEPSSGARAPEGVLMAGAEAFGDGDQNDDQSAA